LEDCHEIPFCDTHGVFYDKTGRMGSRPDELAGGDVRIDEKALFSVLQFGAIIPPLSPWKEIRRLIPGYRYRGTSQDGPVELDRAACTADMSPEQQADEIERLTDHAVKLSTCDNEDPVLLFSGGVDSGLIASRLAALGYGNSLLLNYSFGENDPESLLAEAMAKHLGLRFERVFAQRDLCACLDEPGSIYPQPFGDSSTPPASILARAVVEKLDGRRSLILDGTGADGAFGLVNKIAVWNRVVQVPLAARSAASAFYNRFFWTRPGRTEYLLRIFRRSVDMPFVSAVLAQNPLAGFLYRKISAGEVYNLLEDWVGGWAGDSSCHRIVAADLAMICSNIFAQKAQPILESDGHDVAYPFLQNEMVSTAMASIFNWKMRTPKEPLKRSLSRCVPRQMVYRPKSAFADPGLEVFYKDKFIEYLRSAADNSSPIAFALHRKPLIEACDLLYNKKKLPGQTLNSLWAVTFTDRWYRTAWRRSI